MDDQNEEMNEQQQTDQSAQKGGNGGLGFFVKVIKILKNPVTWTVLGVIAVSICVLMVFSVIIMILSSLGKSCDLYNADSDDDSISYVVSGGDPEKHELEIFNYLVQKEGFSGAGAAGALANAKRESSFSPTAVNYDSGVAGIFQWSGFTKKIKNMDDYVEGERINATGSIKDDDFTTLTMENELKLLHYELHEQSLYYQVPYLVGQETDPFEAAKKWLTEFEGVSLYSDEAKLNMMEEDANYYYIKYAGNLIDPNPDLIAPEENNTAGVTDETAALAISQEMAENVVACGESINTGSGAEGYGLPVKGEYGLGLGTYPSYTHGSTEHDHDGADFQTNNLIDADVRGDSVHVKGRVYAVTSGVISLVKQKGSEWYVVLMGQDGLFTYYGHAMVEPPVKKGEVVLRGQWITSQGWGGKVSNASLGGAHVHFAISKNESFSPGNPDILSPADYLPLPTEVLPDGHGDGGAQNDPNHRVLGDGFKTKYQGETIEDDTLDSGPKPIE